MERLAVTDGRPVAGEVSGADDTAVTLVTHRKVAAHDVEAFEGWVEQSGRSLTGTPGYLGSTVITPTDERGDWTLVQRFTDAASARAWLDGPARRSLYAQIADVQVLDEEVTLFREDPTHGDEVSVLISSTVPAALEQDYLAWQKRISDTEAQFRGFRGHRIQRPVPGVQDEWVVILTFDSAENLAVWIDSPERKRLLREGERFNADLAVATSSFGFDFWTPKGETARESVMKNNLLVLAALYPIVFGWGYFVSTPLVDGPHAIPFWLSLFVGNFVSTQLLGWFVMPRVFKMFAWWLKPKPGWRAQLLGFGILIVVYGASMALYAWLLSLAA